MFVHNLDPIIFSIGPLAIRWYGLVYVLGFLGLYFGLRRIAGLSEKKADSLVLWLILGMFVGARAFFFIFYRPDLFSFAEFFAVWHGGMSFHGALLGMGLAGWYWARNNDENIWRLADVGALLAGWFLALGRVANFINAEIVGTVTDVSWCVQFPTAEGCRHPVQLYAVVKDVVLGLCTLAIYKKSSFREGFIFWSFAWMYSILRFIVNFWRADVTYAFGWLKMGHILSVVLFIVASYAIYTRHSEDISKLFKGS